MLDWLKKKLQPAAPRTFEPRNHLERLLVAAATDPAARPRFYRALLDSQVSVIGHIGEQPPVEFEHYTAKEGDMIRIQNIDFEGRNVIAIFTAPERIAEMAPGAPFVTMLARDLFTMVGPQEAVLNPGSPYGKHFVEDEIRGLLDGSLFEPRQSWVATKPESFLIGKPAKYPHAFVAALQKMLPNRREVKRAYIALIHITSRDEKPNLLVALDVEGDMAAAAADCGIIARDTLEPGEFTDIASTAVAADYFEKDTPIYVRD